MPTVAGSSGSPDRPYPSIICVEGREGEGRSGVGSGGAVMVNHRTAKGHVGFRVEPVQSPIRFDSINTPPPHRDNRWRQGCGTQHRRKATWVVVGIRTPYEARPARDLWDTMRCVGRGGVCFECRSTAAAHPGQKKETCARSCFCDGHTHLLAG